MRSSALLLLSLIVACGACGGKLTPSEPTTDATTADTSTSDTTTTPDTTITVDSVTVDAPRPDTGAPLTDTCAAVGGAFCTPVRWELCPKGFEPISSGDGHYGCGTIQGWCCVPAPPSSCSASGAGNCIAGGCTGCWMKVTDTTLTCETGRSCCIDGCN
jgi:hypothetical protein